MNSFYNSRVVYVLVPQTCSHGRGKMKMGVAVVGVATAPLDLHAHFRQGPGLKVTKSYHT
jgi:hypothetical protein